MSVSNPAGGGVKTEDFVGLTKSKTQLTVPTKAKAVVKFLWHIVGVWIRLL